MAEPNGLVTIVVGKTAAGQFARLALSLLIGTTMGGGVATKITAAPRSDAEIREVARPIAQQEVDNERRVLDEKFKAMERRAEDRQKRNDEAHEAILKAIEKNGD